MDMEKSDIELNIMDMVKSDIELNIMDMEKVTRGLTCFDQINYLYPTKVHHVFVSNDVYFNNYVLL